VDSASVICALMKAEHFCTYFDQGFLPQGLALWRSLVRHDSAAVLWVLALDGFTADVLRRLNEPGLRIVPLVELESGDLALASAKSNRSRIEYYFTLSPCWPLWLLRAKTGIDRLTYVDADMLFFSPPEGLFKELGDGSVLLCGHDFAPFLKHYEKHGRYNVGVLTWRRDANGLACLEWWRERCLEWCYDRLEKDRYADQKYLEQWPQRFAGVVICKHPGINLAPWNWMNYQYDLEPGGSSSVLVDGRPLVLFHFARFRPIFGDRWWQSGQVDYAVMPSRLRQPIYGAYWQALIQAGVEILKLKPTWKAASRRLRFNRGFWRELPLRLVFGSDWLRIGGRFFSLRLGLGRYSGRTLAALRTILLRR
jgi:hypothetical protein